MRVTLVEVVNVAHNPARKAWVNPLAISGVIEEYLGSQSTGRFIVQYGNWEVTVSQTDWKKLAGTRCKIGG